MLESLNWLAGTIGAWVLGAVGFILPVELPAELALPVGWLSLLTVGLALAEVTRKFTWIVVGMGWLLIAIRIVWVVIQT